MQLCNLLHFFRRSLYNIFKILISLTHLNFPLLLLAFHRADQNDCNDESGKYVEDFCPRVIFENVKALEGEEKCMEFLFVGQEILKFFVIFSRKFDFLALKNANFAFCHATPIYVNFTLLYHKKYEKSSEKNQF